MNVWWAMAWKSSEDQVLEICGKKPAKYRTNPMYSEINHLATRWWFQIFLFSPLLGEDFHFDIFWLVFFRWVETTNQSNLCRISSINSMICMIPTNLPFYLSITPMFGRVSMYVKGWTSENGSVMFFIFTRICGDSWSNLKNIFFNWVGWNYLENPNMWVDVSLLSQECTPAKFNPWKVT